ncbi:HAMP domain-containing histidine kinase [Hymenobacter aquaticus]|uniref:histidine kinase n=1 Tax=Hymenobacter aquaticus TaxID=1867101 RepID=A0A4Z0Q6E2_9BACT|nr:HAMP domain-containing sensor histidine kinase [Hymenobacter aquaticus]TGE25255.1 HAMP domain-containing histidine kinase [Hymenobacter aquaticus]
MLIRNKLILRFTLLVLLIQLCLSGFIYYFYATSRQQRFDDRLRGKALMTTRLLLRQSPHPADAERNFRRRDLMTIVDERVSIYGPGGHLLYTSADSLSQKHNSAQLERIRPGAPVRFRDGNLEAVGVYYLFDGQPYHVFAAGRDAFGYQQLAKLRLILLVGNVGGLVLIVLAGWYFADQALRPMARVVRQVEKITASRLNTRVHEGNGTDEIAQLAITFNGMLSRVEQAFEMQKSFLSHASHELRTPLATLRGTLETSLAYDQNLAEAKQSQATAVEELKKVIELTNGLLALAKADDASFRREPVRLDECLARALQISAATYPAQTLHLEYGDLPAEVEDVFVVPGNEHLLTTSLLNLLDNACKYSSGAVWVVLGYDSPRQLRVTVRDAGIGIAAPDLSRVFEPLYRAANGKSRPGYGIGLALTKKIVELHGGRIELTSAEGAGTTATLVLPTAA